MRLRQNLYLVAAATAAPLLFFAVLAAFYVFDQERSGYVSAAQARNRATLAAEDSALQQAIGVLQAFSSSESLARGDWLSLQQEAKTLLRTQPLWRNVLLQRPDGAQLMNARRPAGSELRRQPYETDSLQTAVRTGKPAVSNITFAPAVDPEPGIQVRYPIVRSGTVDYVLTAVITQQVFQQVLDNQRIPPGWVSGLVGRDGRMIARIPAVAPGTMASDDFQTQVTGKREGWYRGRTLEGADTFTAFAQSELTGWKIGFAMPAEAITANAERATLLMTIGILLSVVTGGAIAHFLSQRIAVPMSKLAANAVSLGSGGNVTPVPSNVHEVSQVSDALVSSAETLRERERDLRSSQRTLQAQADTLQEVDTNKTKFLAVLSHELRNPLAPLSAGLTLMARTEDVDRIKVTLPMMQRQIKQMARLIDDLMDVGRIDRGQLELKRANIDMNDVVQTAIEIAKPLIDAKNQRLILGGGIEGAYVHGDALRLAQVISNLLNNASKYTHQGGTIEVSMRRSGDDVAIDVRDDGAGFNVNSAEKIFDMFVRLDDTRGHHTGGLGVGLTISRAIVHHHGGTIDAYSDGPGRGATFAVRLPRTDEPHDELQVRLAEAGKRASTAARRILVADDNTDAADALAQLFRSEGFEVHVRYDGPSALDAAKVFTPEVAFLDLDMPGLTGLQVGKLLRASSPGLVLVAVTGLGQAADIARSLEAGFDAHLTKPASAEDMLRIVRQGR
jgi:signal transduction histidine kinase